MVVAIVAVGIASMIAVSYLLFANDRRERAGRLVDQEAKEIALEGEILQTKAMIQNAVLQYGSLELPEVQKSQLDDHSTISLKLTVDGSSAATVRIPALASWQSDAASFNATLLENVSDPFSGARAQITRVAVDAQLADNVLASGRITNKRVTASPKIDIRQIPVSEFTLYSAGSALEVNYDTFPDHLGRVFAEGNITVNGSVSSYYPLVTGQNVDTGDTGVLTFADQAKDDVYLQLSSGSSTGQAAWINDARTKYDSQIITPAILPVDTAPAFGVYQGTDGAVTAKGGEINLDTLRRACTLEIRAVRQTPPTGHQYSIIARWVQTNGPATVFVCKSVSPARSASSGEGEAQSGSVRGRMRLEPPAPNFVVGTGAAGGVLLGINYATLSAKLSLSSIYLEVDDGTGRPDPAAFVVIRSAEALSKNLSIVTPHRIAVEGNFNVGSIGTFAASLITPQDIQAFAAGYFSPQLGPAR